MKTQIRGKLYNTEIDKSIASSWIGRVSSDFGYINETLFLTEYDDWYLYGVVVRYENTPEDSSSRSEHIIPMNGRQACEWLRRTGNTAALEEYFNRDEDE